MKKEQVFIGNIMVCTKYPDRYAIKQEPAKFQLYKSDATLIKVDDQYVDLDNINSNLDLLKVKDGLKPYFTGVGDLFVDESSLRRYHFEENEKASVKVLKKRK